MGGRLWYDPVVGFNYVEINMTHAPTSTPRRIRVSESVHIRLDKSLITRLRDYAKATNRTLNNLCETLLYAAVEARESRRQEDSH